MKYEGQLKSFQPQHENSITRQNHSGITLVSQSHLRLRLFPSVTF